jgi:hypothetical protein
MTFIVSEIMLEITSVSGNINASKKDLSFTVPKQINRLFELRIGLWKRLALAFVNVDRTPLRDLTLLASRQLRDLGGLAREQLHRQPR